MADNLTPAETRKFWQHMISRHPDERKDGRATAEGTRWHELDNLGLKISLTMGETGVRAFVRGDAMANPKQIEKKMAPARAELEARMGVPMPSDETGRFFIDRLDLDIRDEDNWDAAVDWLFERSQTYEAALSELVKRRG